MSQTKPLSDLLWGTSSDVRKPSKKERRVLNWTCILVAILAYILITFGLGLGYFLQESVDYVAMVSSRGALLARAPVTENLFPVPGPKICFRCRGAGEPSWRERR